MNGGRGYQPGKDLKYCSKQWPTTGKVVAQLKFAFWQNMFVRGQQKRIWENNLAPSFPGYDKTLTIAEARAKMFDHINKVRKLRNRIAHHEPIFSWNLDEDKERIREIVEWRRPGTAQWLDTIEQVTILLIARPA